MRAGQGNAALRLRHAHAARGFFGAGVVDVAQKPAAGVVVAGGFDHLRAGWHTARTTDLCDMLQNFFCPEGDDAPVQGREAGAAGVVAPLLTRRLTSRSLAFSRRWFTGPVRSSIFCPADSASSAGSVNS